MSDDKEEVEVPPEALRETGNGPTVSYEETLLRKYFGDPDGDGVYGKVSPLTPDELVALFEGVDDVS